MSDTSHTDRDTETFDAETNTRRDSNYITSQSDDGVVQQYTTA